MRISNISSRLVAEFLAGEMEIDIEGGGSTTFRRQDLASGVEPDECFYIQHAALVRGKQQIDLAEDPPPATSRFRRSGFPRCFRIDGSTKATPQAATILSRQIRNVRWLGKIEMSGPDT